MLEVRIGLQNYTGVACGLNFEQSVAQNVSPEWDKEHILIRRMLALFPGSTAEEVEGTEKPEPKPAPKVAPTLIIEGDPDDERQNIIVAPTPEEPDDAEDAPLVPGDQVLAHYKEEFRKGVVVKVLESGIIHVNLDDDDANYRVLDDDKVSRLDTEAADSFFKDEE